MPALAQHSSRMTLADFLAWETEQPDRHEFVDGEIYAMTGGTFHHAEIATNLATALRARLSPRGCRVYQSEIMVQCGVDSFYPDVLVQCGPREGQGLIATNPVLIAEVLSKSTARYDKRHKWPRYRRLPSLQTFLLVAQDQLMVEVYRRSGADWRHTSYESFDAALELSDPALTLPLREVYAGIDGLDPAVPLV